MANGPLLSYAGRFALPLVLLVGAVAAWLVAAELGEAEPRAASTTVASAETPMTSVRRVPEFATESTQAERVAAAIATLPADPRGLSCAVVLVDGEPVFEVRPEQSLVGGYAQLLFTSHAALELLGPDFRYVTQVLAEDLPNEDGRVGRGIYLLGSGDPVLMTHTYALGFRPALATRTSIEDLAEAVADVGVTRIEAGIIAIDRRYDDQRSLPGWPESFAADGVIGPLTALQLDDGFAERASANLGVAIPSETPATLAAERFEGLLDEAGVEVSGIIRTVGREEAIPSLVPVASIESPPLGDIVFQIMAVNDAGAAELLLKELGVATASDGTTQAGARAVQQVLRDLGVDVPVAFRDGSGLDPVGGVTCAQLAAGVDAIAPDHPTLEVLPAYNLPGVFDGRLQELEVASDVRLVGGVEGETLSLVGRTVDQGRQISFAAISNRRGGPTADDLAFQQGLVEVVDALRGAGSVESIEVAE